MRRSRRVIERAWETVGGIVITCDIVERFCWFEGFVIGVCVVITCRSGTFHDMAIIFGERKGWVIIEICCGEREYEVDGA